VVTYIIKRILAMLPVFFLVAFVSFGIVCLFPGDYYTPDLLSYAMSGMSPGEAAQALNVRRIAAGVNKPWFVQFWVWFTGVVATGNFGVSWSSLFLPENGLGWTLIIAGSSMIWAWLLGIPIGILSALRKNTWIDHALSGFTYVGFAFPSYVWGSLFFAFVYTCINDNIRGPNMWGLVGYELIGKPLTWYKVGSHMLHLMPAWLIVGAPVFAAVVRHLRISMSDTLGDQYITVARAKGVRERRIIWKHALRNAVNPLLSMFGMMLPRMLTATILLGGILGIPTFGQYLLDAVNWNRQHQLTGALLIYACFLLIGNLIADMLLVVADPRIRYD